MSPRPRPRRRPNSAKARAILCFSRPSRRNKNRRRWNSGVPSGLSLHRWRRPQMSIGTIILIILVIALLGGFSGIGGGPFYGTGYYGGGGLGLVIVILLILVLLGRI